MTITNVVTAARGAFVNSKTVKIFSSGFGIFVIDKIDRYGENMGKIY